MRAAAAPLRVVCVSSGYPRPASVGIDVRVLWLLRAIAAVPDASAVLVTTGDKAAIADSRALAEELGIQVEVLPPPSPSSSSLRRWSGAITARRPVWVGDLFSPAVQARVRELSREAVVIVYLDDAAGQYLLRSEGTGSVIADKHMVMTWMTRLAPSRGRPRLLFHARALLHLRLTTAWERAVVSRSDGVTVTSEADRGRLRSTLGVEAAAVLPSGAEPAASTWHGGGARTAGFLGALDIEPNRHGLERFAASGIERLRDARIELAVAGRGGDNVPRSLNRTTGIVHLGFMEDLGKWFDTIGVLIVPIWSGSGVKTKTVTAMAAGVPIVSTRVGLEGVPALDGVHALVREDPVALAEAAVELIEDPERAAAIGSAGRDLIGSAFSLESATAAYEQLFSDLAT